MAGAKAPIWTKKVKRLRLKHCDCEKLNWRKTIWGSVKETWTLQNYNELNEKVKPKLESNLMVIIKLLLLGPVLVPDEINL